jgi:hypothetical protein
MVVRYVDGAGTCKLGADVKSMSLDLHALAHIRLTEYEVTDDDGRKRVTSIEAADHFGAQLHHTGTYHAGMRNSAITVVSDAGLEGSGKGNQTIAHLNLAGENSVAHLAFLLQRSGGNGMKLLNARDIWVSLIELYGFNLLNCVFSERKPAGQSLNTVKQRLAVAMNANREQAGTDCTADLGTSDSDGKHETLSVSSEDDEASSRVDDTRQQPRSKPIYDPLCGRTAGALAVQPTGMSIFDFLVFDICLAYPFFGLAKK